MRTFLVIGLALSLSGCTALLVGGGGAGGYPAGKDERSAAQVSRDSTATAAVNRRLAADSAVNAYAINVDTNAGRVTLRGTVGSVAAWRRAAEIAASVPAVTSVDNRITVSRE